MVPRRRGPEVGGASGPVLVVYNEFPKRSETFLFREFVAWRRRGLDVRACSLVGASRELPAEMAPFRGQTVYLRSALSAANVWHLPSEAIRALRHTPPLAAWADVRRGGRIRISAAGWLAGVALAAVGRRLGARRIHAAWCNVPAEAAFHASRLLGVPYTVSSHAVDLFVDTPPGARRLAAAEAIFVCNREAAEQLTRENPGLAHRLQLVHHAPDVTRFPLAARRAGPPWRLLAVARLVPKKGLDLLIEVGSQLRGRGLEFDCRIVGDGPLAHDLEHRIRAARLASCFRLTGPSDHDGVARAMAESHVFLSTSRVASDGDREGLPNALVEALLSGLPVVATRTGSVEELLRDGETGRLVAADDASAAAVAVVELTRDYTAALTLGRAGRQRVLDRLSGEDQGGALARVFASSDGEAEAPTRA